MNRRPELKQLAHKPTGGLQSTVAGLLALVLFGASTTQSHADVANTVTVTGSYNGSPVTATDDAAFDVADSTATLTIVKSGTLNDDDGVAGDSAGDTIDWTIEVRNDGNVTINSITVSDTLGTPVCPTSSNDTIATLAPGASETCTLTYTTTQTDFDTDGGGDGDIDNSATANGTAMGGIGAVSGTDTAEVPINAFSAVTLVKTADDDTLRNAGETITYTFVVTNTGNQTLTNVVVSETAFNGTGSPAPAPDADTGSITNDARAPGDSTNSTTGDTDWDVLGPGDELTVTATYTVTQTDVDTLQ